MPARTTHGQKRVLADSTNAHQNLPLTPIPAKKRKLEANSSPAARRIIRTTGLNGKLGSSQPKSQFEEEVLEKLTQDINSLKKRNSEKDQQWARPSLDRFDSSKESLCFQQIEVEEGTLHGGNTAIKLFGVMEVCPTRPPSHTTDRADEDTSPRLDIRSSFTSPASCTISM